MKKTLYRLLPALWLLALPAAALAESPQITLDANTLVRFQEEAHTGFQDRLLVPATQFLGVDLEKLGDGNLSGHLYGWGRLDLADDSLHGTAKGKTEGSLTYGYLQYRFGAANAQARAGRIFVHEGIVNEQVDGV